MERSFIVSSPGKTILFGEHAVVYGATAVAASISLRTYCRIEPSEKPEIVIKMRDIGTKHSWPLESLPWKAVPAKDVFHPPNTLNNEIVAALEKLLTNEKKSPLVFLSMLCILYLYLQIGSPTQGCVITINSEVPLGAGLGSSATVSVDVATCLLLFFGFIQPPITGESLGRAETLTLIEAWSFIGECCIQGSPSGIDNAAATHGGLIAFRKSTAKTTAMKQFLKLENPLSVLVTDTKQPKSTKELIQRVFRLRERSPLVIDSIFQTIDGISRSAIEALETVTDVFRLREVLGELIFINQKMLEALNVSHVTIEQVINATKSIGPTKLTGAGGGGCTVTLRNTDCSNEMVEDVITELDSLKNSVYDIQLGGPGVAVVSDSAPYFAEFVETLESKKYNLLNNLKQTYF
ncbi:mevalonate kinase Erg12 [Schizosaccharomyces cryophilus OY26]|uniref:Mevalonate kinase n=1 Tax=Schizosaccharomyces cryophilus (strain OY26 / ATCC MYA-4695 / CBS 11777 / NBRC 106824 / NRRL Y48691) TaxID=653667 RepID=S9W2L4_SCHCR|nr:mevalonate kinase Erg12 [Schizosaccharomyces cryophilus OY26]EPY52689.1 mevalonate kinase Erg12 [Schizosaccharomyces cryophilus OY26]